MLAVKERACAILGEFERAQTELVGNAVILSDGKAGTVESVLLDEIHGLRNRYPGTRREVARLDHQIRSDGLRRLREMNASGFSAGYRHPVAPIGRA